jgi:IS1 family transposase
MRPVRQVSLKPRVFSLLTFRLEASIMSGMANVLSTQKRAAIVSALIEGVSVRATARMMDVSKDTVSKLSLELGEACIKHMDENLRNLPCKRLQVDEIWAFCYAKAKNVPADKQGVFGFGDLWAFTAIDADTKLIPTFLVGSRDAGCATEFMQDLAGRLSGRVQLTSDGHKMYVSAVEDAFAGAIDYAMLVKVYGAAPEGPEVRYSPAQCLGAQKQALTGCPDPAHVSTSYVERHNLTLRMGMRRYTRLTNAHSKKLQNHTAALGLFLCFYNYCRIHQSIRVTPCMAAGITARVWSIADLLDLLPPVAAGKKRGPYKKQAEISEGGEISN